MATSDRIFSVDEYIRHELSAATRHEFLNGQLFEMPGEKDINNEIALAIAFLFMQVLKSRGYQVYAHDVKVKIHGENKYYYPDVFVTKEEKTEDNIYIKKEPVLIVEVVSESTQVNDYVDKYIDYTKIPSLKYYLIVEPETMLLTMYKRSEGGEWTTFKFTKAEEDVKLDDLDVSFKLQQVYP
ncbi:Uma2 family endonuclease [Aridibaculum aurantiacum]|uniref:Uma2 family endonuclease n=1 Tax=Aridibaculum aurantiacum TaxID=2810307 RepID=UPI001A960122|nr:Uma2 family endonuclease [Aridibaculum aurantiacum]